MADRLTGYRSNTCIACGYQIRGTRVVCIDCQPQDGDYTRTVDVCDDRRCRETVVKADTKESFRGPHLPSHDFFKVRTVVHLRDMHAVNQDVLEALQCARRVFSYNDILNSDESIMSVEQTCAWQALYTVVLLYAHRLLQFSWHI